MKKKLYLNKYGEYKCFDEYCDGTGWTDDSFGGVVHCYVCRGRGYLEPDDPEDIDRAEEFDYILIPQQKPEEENNVLE